MELYFCKLLDALDLGAHHFPDGCLIERTYYEQLTREACDAREKHEISARLNAEFEYLIKLYECYFEFKSRGGEVDFYALCEKAGLNFAPAKAFYYEGQNFTPCCCFNAVRILRSRAAKTHTRYLKTNAQGKLAKLY